MTRKRKGLEEKRQKGEGRDERFSFYQNGPHSQGVWGRRKCVAVTHHIVTSSGTLTSRCSSFYLLLTHSFLSWTYRRTRSLSHSTTLRETRKRERRNSSPSLVFLKVAWIKHFLFVIIIQLSLKHITHLWAKWQRKNVVLRDGEMKREDLNIRRSRRCISRWSVLGCALGVYGPSC